MGAHAVPQEVHRPRGLPRPALVGRPGATADGREWERRGSENRVGLDYKSVTRGEPTLSGDSVDDGICLFGLLRRRCILRSGVF